MVKEQEVEEGGRREWKQQHKSKKSVQDLYAENYKPLMKEIKNINDKDVLHDYGLEDWVLLNVNSSQSDL